MLIKRAALGNLVSWNSYELVVGTVLELGCQYFFTVETLGQLDSLLGARCKLLMLQLQGLHHHGHKIRFFVFPSTRC